MNPVKKVLFSIMTRPALAQWVLKALLKVDQRIYSYLGLFAVASEGGLHPKHRLMKYHQFFIDNIEEGDTVLDVGCGNGALLKDVALKSMASAAGIEISANNVKAAKASIYGLPYVEIIHADIWNYKEDREFDVIILSNVLEHMDHRSELLASLSKRFKPKKFLIRVPMFEREWLVPYKKEMGVEWRLDSTHEIEYTEDEFKNELSQSGLDIRMIMFKWGEMYVVAVPQFTQDENA